LCEAIFESVRRRWSGTDNVRAQHYCSKLAHMPGGG
jgi:hypothetical protein